MSCEGEGSMKGMVWVRRVKGIWFAVVVRRSVERSVVRSGMCMVVVFC